MKKTVLTALIVSLLLTLVGCGCEHEWSEATCTEAPVCTKCGESEGEALGHVWEAATCTEPETCKSCGTTQGEALGHTPGSWEYDGEVDCLSDTQSASLFCASCGAVVDTKTEPLTSMVKDGSFLFTGEEFTERISRNLLEVVGSELVAKYSEDGYNGDPLCQILSPTGNLPCSINFDDSEVGSPLAKHGARDIANIICGIYDFDPDVVLDTVTAIVLSCDPSLSLDGAEKAIGEIMSAAENDDDYELNGIVYSFSVYNKFIMFRITIAD